MKKKETRGQPIALILGSIRKQLVLLSITIQQLAVILSMLVVQGFINQLGNKRQSKDVVKMIKN